MNLTGRIESAELQFKQILEDFFMSVYDDESLPSHGLAHHRRVWNYAKELLASIDQQNSITDTALPENLIIACYLHDIGMSVDPGIKHGHHSKDLCIKFLKSNNLDAGNYPDLLTAIENHDNKDYKTTSGKFDLLTILSVADDLDAFGFVGIYRYTEIYLTRGIGLKEIGSLILKNAEQRFDNFTRTFGIIEPVFLKQSERFKILKEFFEKYNSGVKTYNFEGTDPSGYCGVIEMLSEMIKERKGLDELFLDVEQYSEDKIINWFFTNLKSESKYKEIPR
ncbi:MAG: HD domain-containing protein [Bacteroidales bacterium]|nr:HD domain-containing protein [Bacteroidales bacterium]